MARSKHKQPRRKAASSQAPAVAPARQLVEFDAQDIGGELISLLSEGLYSNPLDALREYIQNAIDAKANRVWIKFTGRGIFIRDDGHGMTREELIHARRFAVSDKSISANIGFRGIGIYAAFHICDKMRIRTKVSGTFAQNFAEFDFASMRKVLSQQRGSATPQRTPLIELLSKYVTFWEEEYANEDASTVVELHGIADLQYRDLASRLEVERYLLDTVPIDFAESFPYRAVVNARLKGAWADYHPITVILQYGTEDYLVRRKMPEHLDAPMFREARDDSRKLQAFVWGCRTSTKGIINKDYSDLAGFIYKMKGISIGGRAELVAYFSQKTLYRWWTGEVYVLNDRVIPNAARNGFEVNAASYNLEAAVQKTLSEYEREALRFQAVRRASEIISEIESDLSTLRASAESGVLTPDEAWKLVELGKAAKNQITTLKKHEKSDKDAADAINRATVLSQQLVDLAKGVTARRPTEDDGTPRSQRIPRSARPKPLASDAGPVVTVPSLSNIMSEVDPADAERLLYTLRSLIETIEELMGPASQQYRDIVEALRIKLGDIVE